MSWQVLILISVLSMIIGQAMVKKLVKTLHPFQILVYQYLVSIIMVYIYHFFIYPTEKIVFGLSPFLGIGVLFAVGISSYMRAVKFSLSKSALTISFDNLIAILLAAIFLGEFALLNPQTFDGLKTLFGLGLAGVSVWLIKGDVKSG